MLKPCQALLSRAKPCPRLYVLSFCSVKRGCVCHHENLTLLADATTRKGRSKLGRHTGNGLHEKYFDGPCGTRYAGPHHRVAPKRSVQSVSVSQCSSESGASVTLAKDITSTHKLHLQTHCDARLAQHARHPHSQLRQEAGGYGSHLRINKAKATNRETSEGHWGWETAKREND